MDINPASMGYPIWITDFPDRRDQPNQHGMWKVRSRQVLFGSQPITEDGKFVVLLKKQKIYGSDDYDWSAGANTARERFEETCKRIGLAPSAVLPGRRKSSIVEAQ